MVTMPKNCFPCTNCSQQALFFYKAIPGSRELKKKVYNVMSRAHPSYQLKNLLQDKSSWLKFLRLLQWCHAFQNSEWVMHTRYLATLYR